MFYSIVCNAVASARHFWDVLPAGTVLHLLKPIAAGFRLALVVFAVMHFLAWHRKGSIHSSWLLMAAAIIAYSPAHASWLLGHPWRREASMALDVVGTALACAGMIARLAHLGRQRGLSAPRIRGGVYANLIVLFGLVGAAWLTR